MTKSEVGGVLVFPVGVHVYSGDGGGAELVVVHDLAEVGAVWKTEEAGGVEGGGPGDEAM
jgi:hypothetical protein